LADNATIERNRVKLDTEPPFLLVQAT